MIAAVILALALGLGSSLYMIDWTAGLAQWSAVSILGLVIAGGLLALFYVFNLIRALEIVRCEDKQKPSLELDFRDEEPPYHQRRVEEGWELDFFRVSVKNTSPTKSVFGVEVELVGVEPLPNHLFLPLVLHFKGDEPQYPSQKKDIDPERRP